MGHADLGPHSLAGTNRGNVRGRFTPHSSQRILADSRNPIRAFLAMVVARGCAMSKIEVTFIETHTIRLQFQSESLFSLRVHYIIAMRNLVCAKPCIRQGVG